MKKIKTAILLIAVIAMLPVFSVTAAAATENEVTYVAVPKKDMDYSKDPTAAPQLIIKAKHDTWVNAVFKLRLSAGTKWTFKDAASLAPYLTVTGKTYTSNMSLSSSNALDYTITQISNTDIQVVVNGVLTAGEYIIIPLIVKLNGVAEASVSITDGETSGITSGKYVFANEGYVNSAELETNADAKADGGVITGDIKINLTAGLGDATLEFILPKGFAFANSIERDIKLVGSGSYEDAKISGFRSDTPMSTIVVKITGAPLSTSEGRLVLENIKVNALEDAPTGDIIMQFKGFQSKNVTFKFGTYEAAVEAPPEVKPEEKPEAGSLVITASATSGSKEVVVNGEAMEMPAAPYNDENGRMMVPLRFITSAFGVGNDNIKWDANSKTATVVFATPTSKSEVAFQIGSDTYMVNGEQKPMDTAAVIKDGFTFVPVKYVAEAFGIGVNYNNETKTAEFTGNFEW